MPNGIDEIFTIRLSAHPVNAEMRPSFVGHHISATFEHSSILIVVMADFWARVNAENHSEKYETSFATDL